MDFIEGLKAEGLVKQEARIVLRGTGGAYLKLLM